MGELYKKPGDSRTSIPQDPAASGCACCRFLYQVRVLEKQLAALQRQVEAAVPGGCQSALPPVMQASVQAHDGALEVVYTVLNCCYSLQVSGGRTVACGFRKSKDNQYVRLSNDKSTSVLGLTEQHRRHRRIPVHDRRHAFGRALYLAWRIVEGDAANLARRLEQRLIDVTLLALGRQRFPSTKNSRRSGLRTRSFGNSYHIADLVSTLQRPVVVCLLLRQ